MSNREDSNVTITRRGNGFVDIIGKEFGHLTVLEQASSIDGAAAWLCRCECGDESVIKGTELRKGNRRSCGCKSPGGRRAPVTRPRRAANPPSPRGHYWLVELDGFVALVESTQHGEALVEFDPTAKAWDCSICGLQPPKLTCGHVGAVTARLPVKTALRIASIVASAKDRSMSSKVGAALEGADINAKSSAVALAKTAAERAERIAQRDAEYRAIVGEVTVRQATDEDRARLAERRAAKRGVVGAA